MYGQRIICYEFTEVLASFVGFVKFGYSSECFVLRFFVQVACKFEFQVETFKFILLLVMKPFTNREAHLV